MTNNIHQFLLRFHASTKDVGSVRVSTLVVVLIPLLSLSIFAASPMISSSQPNVVSFPAQEAKLVRFVIHRSSSNQPCIDELEVYGPDGKRNLALARNGGKASASSCLAGYVIHQIPHLNDGKYGNDFSWIAATTGKEWAQIELPKASKVSKIVFTRDRSGRYADRIPIELEIQLSMDGKIWSTVKKVRGRAETVAPTSSGTITFRRQHAKFVRLYILTTKSGGAPCIDEIELYGVEQGLNLALAKNGGTASASSNRPSEPAAHLNDGKYGMNNSWTAAGRNRQWAQIEMPKPTEVERVVFSCHRSERGDDRAPTVFEVQISMDGAKWKTVAQRGRGIVGAPPPPPRNKAGGSAGSIPKDLKVPKSDELGFANLALNSKAKPNASSLLPGYAIHQIPHLNDGLYGNSHSWIAGYNPGWAEIDLGDVFWVYRVAFGSDSSGKFDDRAATHFTIQTAETYSRDSNTKNWTTVVRQTGGPPIHFRTEFKFRPIKARWARISVNAANRSECRIDEIEVYGQKDPISRDKIGQVADYPPPAELDHNDSLRHAFLGEEYAWLKTFGRADMDTRLVDYVRVWEYPRHVGDDRLPLPPLASAPRIDGSLNDPCWRGASRGVARVAYPDDFDKCLLANHEIFAVWKGDELFLAIRTERLLSSHVVIVSSGDWKGLGAVAYTSEGFVFSTYTPVGNSVKLERSEPIEGAFNEDFTACEIKLPLAIFPGCRDKGLRVGLGMGGRHTRSYGRPVEFTFSPLAIAEQAPCVNRTFRVRLTAFGDVSLRGNAPSLEDGLTLTSGQSKVIEVPANRGPIGPEYDLRVEERGGESYVLHLFRYDPVERTLSLMEDMANRLSEKGLDCRGERDEIKQFRERQEELMSLAVPDTVAERRAFFDARMAKRRLFMRAPDLAPIERILCVKRHNFEPSHNYSVILDARGGPGGSVNILEIPRRDGRLEPDETKVKKLFDAGKGIARNPIASFDASKIYFGYCRSKGDYYHIVRINPDGTGLKQITDGPFHDYWPCPLPDGGIAFISSRCRARFLCWRPQASVLFRMDADGSNIRPLSFANLTEWGPSVMSDGRIIWQRSEYVDKGADFSHTLWSIRPDGGYPALVFGNSIIQPNGYANGREVPGTSEVCCTLISHFGDLNGPIALIDINKGRFNPKAITSITPEVPWPGLWPAEECFRDPVPIARDYFLCAHAPQRRFGIYVIDRFGNREVIYDDPAISTMCPTPFRKTKTPPVLSNLVERDEPYGEFTVADVYRGISPPVKRGAVKYIRVAQEVRADLEQLVNGEYRKDHPSFQDWYATPIHKVSGPYGWPSYVAKASWGIVPVEEDGSARFYAPAGKVLYFQVLDKDFNELQRMRSVVQLQPGEKRSCIGCHDPRHTTPPAGRRPLARKAQKLRAAPWEGKPFSFEKVVQPVLNKKCVQCHDGGDKMAVNLTGALDIHKVPASYRTLISRGLVHYADYSYNPGGNEKREPLTLGTLRSKLWKVLNAGHYDVKLTTDEMLRIKTWIDLNCPLWPDYIYRPNRPGAPKQVSKAN